MTSSEFDTAMAKDADSAIAFVYEKADFKQDEHGLDALTSGERTVLAVEGFFGQASNGGLEQFLDSEAGDLAQELPRALARAGLKKYVRLAEEMVLLFEGAVPQDSDERWARKNAWDDADLAKLEKLTARFFEIHAVAEARKRLIAFIHENKADFVKG